jgi:hypothetical protein
VYFPDSGEVRVYWDVIFNEMPLLANVKRRHTLLPDELEEWPEEEALEHPTPEAPAPAHAPSASFPDKHVSLPTPPSSLSNYHTHIGHKKKCVDFFSDSESDDEALVARVPVAPAPVAPALPSPVAPIMPSPVFPIDNHPDSDSDSSWADPEPAHMDHSEGTNLLTPSPSPRGSDCTPKDDEHPVQDTPPASLSMGTPPQISTGRPIKTTSKPSAF